MGTSTNHYQYPQVQVLYCVVSFLGKILIVSTLQERCQRSTCLRDHLIWSSLNQSDHLPCRDHHQKLQNWYHPRIISNPSHHQSIRDNHYSVPESSILFRSRMITSPGVIMKPRIIINPGIKISHKPVIIINNPRVILHPGIIISNPRVIIFTSEHHFQPRNHLLSYDHHYSSWEIMVIYSQD